MHIHVNKSAIISWFFGINHIFSMILWQVLCFFCDSLKKFTFFPQFFKEIWSIQHGSHSCFCCISYVTATLPPSKWQQILMNICIHSRDNKIQCPKSGILRKSNMSEVLIISSNHKFEPICQQLEISFNIFNELHKHLFYETNENWMDHWRLTMCTISLCPCAAARCNAVSSPIFVAFILAPRKISISTMFALPSFADQCRGLNPWSSLKWRNTN